jgi:hypothetical protein
MAKIWSTRQVARLLEIPPDRLSKAIWGNRIEAPGKGPGGAYVWGRDDILRAGWVILHRDVSAIVDAAEQGGGERE